MKTLGNMPSASSMRYAAKTTRRRNPGSISTNPSSLSTLLLVPPNLALCSCVPIAATTSAKDSSGSNFRLSTSSGAPRFMRCLAE